MGSAVTDHFGFGFETRSDRCSAQDTRNWVRPADTKSDNKSRAKLPGLCFCARNGAPVATLCLRRHRGVRDAAGMGRIIGVLIFAWVCCWPGFAGEKKDAEYVPVLAYDVQRDPAKDLTAAIAEAHRSDRNILLDVGGTWCKWCHFMDKFFEDHADLKELRDKSFVVVYVNFSEGHENEKFLRQFPKPEGFPHLYVLNADGKLIKSEETGELEDGKSSYMPEKVREFLVKYGAGK